MAESTDTGELSSSSIDRLFDRLEEQGAVSGVISYDIGRIEQIVEGSCQHPRLDTAQRAPEARGGQ